MAAQETASATLPIGNIQPDPNQPRKYFDEEGLAELTQSIQDKGVIQPILVRAVTLDESGVTLSPSKGGPESPQTVVLVAGERRLRAAQAAGLTEIPALFIEDKPEEIALIENSLRQDLTAILTGIAALHTRVDKADWQAFSIEDRSQIKEAFMALYDTLDAIPESSGKQPA